MENIIRKMAFKIGMDITIWEEDLGYIRVSHNGAIEAIGSSVSTYPSEVPEMASIEELLQSSCTIEIVEPGFESLNPPKIDKASFLYYLSGECSLCKGAKEIVYDEIYQCSTCKGAGIVSVGGNWEVCQRCHHGITIHSPSISKAEKKCPACNWRY